MPKIKAMPHLALIVPATQNEQFRRGSTPKVAADGELPDNRDHQVHMPAFSVSAPRGKADIGQTLRNVRF